jgi:CRISP-associated protein Cas1
MGHEGVASRYYWEAIAKALPEDYTFKGRSRQPALDQFNAVLNYVYGMLYNVVERAVLSAGLDPQMGVLHADSYGQPTLVYDLIETFRPWADRLVCTFCLEATLLSEHTEPKDNGIWLSKTGRRTIIPAFNDWLKDVHQLDDMKMPIQGFIFREAVLLANILKGTTENL